MKPLVTVIIPVYNVEKYINKCVDSVIDQTYSNLQIILVDDESPDMCPQICDQYANVDDRIEVIHKENGGLGLARNTALKRVEGDYVVFLDSDDWLDLNHIECLVNNALANDADIVVHGYRKCHKNEVAFWTISLSKQGIFEDVVNDVLLPMIAADDNCPSEDSLPMGVCFKMFKTSVITDNLLTFIDENEMISEDMFFNIDYLKKCKKAVLIDECGYNYRFNEKSLSNKYDPDRMRKTIDFYINLKSKINEDRILRNNIKNRCERVFLMKIRTFIRSIVNSDIKYIEKRKEIKKVITNDYVQKAINSYPIKNYKPSIRLVSSLIKRKNVTGVIFLFACQKITKKRS